MNSYRDIVKAIKDSKRVALICHVNPDGDCIGSMLGLGLALRGLEKDVTMFSTDRIPDIYDFLPGRELITHEVNLEQHDLLIFVDCSDLERAGEQVAQNKQNYPPIINLDHHISNKGFGQYNLIDATAAATGEIIYNLLLELGVTVDVELATCLYTAIVMDTGSFRYDNTNARTHQIAGELVKTGLVVSKVSQSLFEDMPIESLRVLKLGLANLHLSDDGTIAWIVLTKEDLISLEAKEEHTDGLINYARMIKGVEIAIFFREADNGIIKLSFRSKNRADVNLLAGEFGGGGHPRASGCRIELPMNQAIQQVITAATRHLEGN